MHPELISTLATEHRRDMTADLNAHRPVKQRAVRHAPHLTVPRLRVTWSRTTQPRTACDQALPSGGCAP
jgi:hypothetical protein